MSGSSLAFRYQMDEYEETSVAQAAPKLFSNGSYEPAAIQAISSPPHRRRVRCQASSHRRLIGIVCEKEYVKIGLRRLGVRSWSLMARFLSAAKSYVRRERAQARPARSPRGTPDFVGEWHGSPIHGYNWRSPVMVQQSGRKRYSRTVSFSSLNYKTRSANRGSKARGALCQSRRLSPCASSTTLKTNSSRGRPASTASRGAGFSHLLRRQRELPFVVNPKPRVKLPA